MKWNVIVKSSRTFVWSSTSRTTATRSSPGSSSRPTSTWPRRSWSWRSCRPRTCTSCMTPLTNRWAGNQWAKHPCRQGKDNVNQCISNHIMEDSVAKILIDTKWPHKVCFLRNIRRLIQSKFSRYIYSFVWKTKVCKACMPRCTLFAYTK